MELTGDLSDFALTDILQILALSRKSGMLSLESGGLAGVVIVEHGRITHASLRPGESLAERLVRENLISSEKLDRLRGIGAVGGGVWTLRTLVLESGVLDDDDLEDATRRHIQDVVASLVQLEKGRFGIALNQVIPVESLDETALLEGLEIGEVLLGAAKDLDEAGREDAFAALSNASNVAANLAEWPGFGEPPGFEERGDGADKDDRTDTAEGTDRASRRARDGHDRMGRAAHGGTGGHRSRAHRPYDRSDRASLLFSMLAELRSHSFEAEVSLLIMRYASEVATRGVLFVVRDQEICGLGQFGVSIGDKGKSPDEKVREIRIPLGAKSVFDDVVKRNHPFIGKVPDNYWHSEMFRHIGGNGMPLSAFAIPLVCNDRPVFIFYGDNYPGLSELSGIDELVALINQASVVLEKIVLERMLNEIRHKN